MNKKRMADLMLKANKILESSGILQRDDQNQLYIEESYNGQTSSFGVTVAMSGLLPALVIFYQETSDNRKIDRKKILEAIGGMINSDKPQWQINNARSLLEKALGCGINDENLKKEIAAGIKKEVLECASALKQIIRTYELK